MNSMSDMTSEERCDEVSEEDDQPAANVNQVHHKPPPDGGWGWVVCLGAWIVNFLTVGQQNAAGVVYSALLNEYSTKRGETAWVASLASSMMYLFAAVGTSLAERFGSRLVVIIGSFVSASGLLASSFATTLTPLYGSYGIIWGLGASLGLFPSLVILTKYFRRRLALASGMALAGAACGTLVYGPVIQLLVSKYGISVTFRILAAVQSLMFMSGLIFRPVESHKACRDRRRENNGNIFKNKAYVIWVASLCVFMLVFLVPFVHLVRFTEDKGINTTKASLLTGYMAFGGLTGSIVFGIACDHPQFNRLKVCQLSLLLIAISSSLVTMANKYVWICVYAFTFGVFDGCYEMLVPVITRDIAGSQRVAHAIGLLYCMMAFPKTLGPPIAGWLFDLSNDYSVSFYVTSAVTIIATAVMFLLNWVPLHKDRIEMEENEMHSPKITDEPSHESVYDGFGINLTPEADDSVTRRWLPIYWAESRGEYEYREKLTVL